ncbi:MAG: hypothetical protein DMG16_27370 [Acidobacteria bacterium]|nr:MAG: hypothetical protein DMG16_27370 [Acidobacteriota bacterium]
MMIQFLSALLVSSGLAFSADAPRDYRVLATNKTSTMEKELNEAANAGYHFEATMGGESAYGGSEVIVIMAKDRTEPSSGRYVYKLLATNKTSTMQKELQEAGREAFQYKGQTVFKTAYGGQEVVVILEADRQAASKKRYDYKLLATSRTSTMQKELQEAGDAGFVFVGMTISHTAFGGKEVVSILRKEVAE